MPTFVKGDMWSVFGKTDHFIITTNPIVRKDGACVMGAGIAKQFAQRYPKGPFALGDEIKMYVSLGYSVVDMTFGAIGVFDDQLVQYFMVKEHWHDAAKPRIIRDSARRLRDAARVRPDERYDLNFPGIGNGSLPKSAVLPMIEDLPNNVHIWEFE